MKNYTFSVEIDDSGKVIIDSDGNMDGILILGFLELEKAKQLNNVIARSKGEPTYEVVDEEKPVEGV